MVFFPFHAEPRHYECLVNRLGELLIAPGLHQNGGDLILMEKV